MHDTPVTPGDGPDVPPVFTPGAPHVPGEIPPAADDPRPGTSDRTPGAEPEPQEEPSKPVNRRTRTRQIREALKDVLQLPAAPFDPKGGFVDDPWMHSHFMMQGDQLATQIAEVSERNEILRTWCERLMVGDSLATLAFGALMYAYPPLVHLGVAPGVGPFAVIPVIGQPPPPQEAPVADDTDGRVPGAPDRAAPPAAHTP